MDPLVREVDAASAGIIVMQAMNHTVASSLREHLGAGWTFHSTSEFFLATRYPIVSVGDQKDGERFLQYTLDTPLGILDVFNMHPYSPRAVFALRHLSKKNRPHGRWATSLVLLKSGGGVHGITQLLWTRQSAAA